MTPGYDVSVLTDAMQLLNTVQETFEKVDADVNYIKKKYPLCDSSRPSNIYEQLFFIKVRDKDTATFNRLKSELEEAILMQTALNEINRSPISFGLHIHHLERNRSEIYYQILLRLYFEKKASSFVILRQQIKSDLGIEMSIGSLSKYKKDAAVAFYYKYHELLALKRDKATSA